MRHIYIGQWYHSVSSCLGLECNGFTYDEQAVFDVYLDPFKDSISPRRAPQHYIDKGGMRCLMRNAPLGDIVVTD